MEEREEVDTQEPEGKEIKAPGKEWTLTWPLGLVRRWQPGWMRVIRGEGVDLLLLRLWYSN